MSELINFLNKNPVYKDKDGKIIIEILCKEHHMDCNWYNGNEIINNEVTLSYFNDDNVPKLLIHPFYTWGMMNIQATYRVSDDYKILTGRNRQLYFSYFNIGV